MDWQDLYIIEKILKRKCLKWALMTHLDISNTSYGQKKGRESNWQFDSWPLKVRNRPNFLVWRWRVTYHSKGLNKGYNFSLNFILIKVLHTKLWGPKVAGVPTLGNFKTPIWESRDKRAIWMWASWRGTKYTIRGEGGGFSQVRGVVSLVSLNLFVVRPSTKSAPTMH